ncbi:hypothetical protein CPLU01_15257 [Colletotrichum plurivorum]|uniref:Uncharacterized protein n=1 Tax=Colletotrichum plurivorum TaxID=2175906 RepID=A0A8H6JCX2_9PEZI|nr:hypothetical protein CPLU01_15257 [Colletotrichum plurivorum]
MTGLLDLPIEIRENIYRYCLGGEPSYSLNPYTNKMTNPDGSWIDLRITMTCKQIHDEASDYALRQMKFSTWSGQASGTYAGRFEYIMTALQHCRASLAPCLEAVKADSHVGPGGYPESCREIPSVFRKLVRSCIQKSSSDGRHRNKPSKSTTTSPATLYTDVQLATLDPAPWSIPSLRDLERMESSIRSARARFLQGLDI